MTVCRGNPEANLPVATLTTKTGKFGNHNKRESIGSGMIETARVEHYHDVR
jgi:hypothetical protein